MTTASLAHVHRVEELLFIVLAQLVIIVVAARFAGHAATRIGQTRVVGEIVVGHLLAREHRAAVGKVAAIGLALPFALGLAFARLSAARAR